MIEQESLRAHHVAHHDDRKLQVVGLAGPRIDAGRAGRAEAGADDIGADDEIAVGVEDFARADHVVPPAGLAVLRGMAPGRVGIAGPGVGDQDGIVLGCVELAVGFIGERQRSE